MTTKQKKEFIPALGYNWLTKFYDLTIKITMPEKKFRSRLIEILAPTVTDKILEFGFGTGQNLILAKNKHPETTFVGLDIDPQVKAIASQKMESNKLNITLILYDGDDFPFETNEFNRVYSSLVFHQLDTETKKKCLKEINRILKPKGLFVLGDWGKTKTKLQRFLFYFVQILDGFKTTQENVEGLLPQYMEDCGFEQVKEVDDIKTKIGTYCYYVASKP